MAAIANSASPRTALKDELHGEPNASRVHAQSTSRRCPTGALQWGFLSWLRAEARQGASRRGLDLSPASHAARGKPAGRCVRGRSCRTMPTASRIETDLRRTFDRHVSPDPERAAHSGDVPGPASRNTTGPLSHRAARDGLGRHCGRDLTSIAASVRSRSLPSM